MGAGMYRGRGVGKSLYLPLSFVMEPKTALKILVFKKEVIELYIWSIQSLFTK